MKLTAKLTVTMILITAATAAVIGTVGGLAAISSGEQTLRGSVEDRLAALNDNRARELEDLMNRARRRIGHIASAPATESAASYFASAFASVEHESQRAPDALKAFYRDTYGDAYEARNGAPHPDPTAPVASLSPTTANLQMRYIVDNPNPLGEKQLLNVGRAADEYDIYHSREHENFRRFLDTFGYYDLFLIEPDQGDVVYSVYKELDFGTSLRDGPWADSGLAEVYEAVLRDEEIAFSGVGRYGPSYGDSALFVGAPIHDGGGNLASILVLQMPMPQFDALLTSGGDWGALGLGATGESYLVGPDGRVLTDLRQRAEHPEGFAAAVAELELDPRESRAIDSREHPGGRLPEATEQVVQALAPGGEAGTVQTRDFLGREVIKSWRPVQFGASTAGLVSQQGGAEALAPLAQLRQDIGLRVAAVTLLVCAVGGLAGWRVAARIASPVRELAAGVQRVAAERDLTQRFETARRDEIGLIARAVDGMLVNFRELLGEVTDTASEVGTAAADTAATSEQTHERVIRQQEETRQVATAMTEMAASVEEVARHVQEVATTTRDARGTCDTGDEQVQALAARIGELAEQVQAANRRVADLHEDARKVDEIVSLIADVSEQTNLLALNAAIESARAGEHGRGFAVVADEVRALAGRTRAAADEVRTTIDRLQGATGSANAAMEQQQETARACVEAAESTGTSFQHINERVGRITELMDQVAGAAEEQSQVVVDIDRRLASISDIADESAEASQRVAVASGQLSTRTQGMEEAARRFRTR